jgi:AmmeMemoRadiSam system protein A
MTGADRLALLDLARRAVEAHVQRLPAPVAGLIGALAVRAGVFVSIHNGADLRGCIGHIEADEALGVLVPRSAIAACSADPRFPPIDAGELPALRFEISVLGPLESLKNAQDIVIGRDGLVIEDGRNRGLLLPQVAVQWRWDRETFLSQTCQKAGLPRDAWRKGATLWRFEAEVFHE